jgi:hypothetical protein
MEDVFFLRYHYAPELGTFRLLAPNSTASTPVGRALRLKKAALFSQRAKRLGENRMWGDVGRPDQPGVSAGGDATCADTTTTSLDCAVTSVVRGEPFLATTATVGCCGSNGGEGSEPTLGRGRGGLLPPASDQLDRQPARLVGASTEAVGLRGRAGRAEVALRRCIGALQLSEVPNSLPCRDSEREQIMGFLEGSHLAARPCAHQR